VRWGSSDCLYRELSSSSSTTSAGSSPTGGHRRYSRTPTSSPATSAPAARSTWSTTTARPTPARRRRLVGPSRLAEPGDEAPRLFRVFSVPCVPFGLGTDQRTEDSFATATGDWTLIRLGCRAALRDLGRVGESRRAVPEGRKRSDGRCSTGVPCRHREGPAEAKRTETTHRTRSREAARRPRPLEGSRTELSGSPEIGFGRRKGSRSRADETPASALAV